MYTLKIKSLLILTRIPIPTISPLSSPFLWGRAETQFLPGNLADWRATSSQAFVCTCLSCPVITPEITSLDILSRHRRKIYLDVRFFRREMNRFEMNGFLSRDRVYFGLLDRAISNYYFVWVAHVRPFGDIYFNIWNGFVIQLINTEGAEVTKYFDSKIFSEFVILLKLK